MESQPNTPISSMNNNDQQSLNENEMESSLTSTLDIGSLKTRLYRLEHKESTRSSVEEQLLLENSQLRAGLETLQSKVSQLEGEESESQFLALQRKVSMLEEQLGTSYATRNVNGGESESPGDDTETDARRRFDKDDNFEGDLEKTLPNDTFSFITVGRWYSAPFLLAIAVVLFQLATFSLAGYNVIRPGNLVNEQNPFNFPVNVDSAVRTAQVIAIVISIMTQDDIRTGLNMVLEGYNQESLQRGFRHATGWKWALSIFTRLLEGGVGLVVTWLLIMTAETVVDLLLNFTAMEFVSQLDDVVYFMSQEGFFGQQNIKKANKINRTPYLCTRRASYLQRFALLAVMFVCLIAGWLTVSFNQTNGNYLCNTVFVQFGDDFNGILGAFSGLYDRRSRSAGIFSAKHVEYVDRQTGTSVFGYCADLRAWTFNYNARGSVDPCDWLVKSDEITSFDFVDTASVGWVVKSETRSVSLERFYLECYDCEENIEDQCGGRGCCHDAVCDCDDGWYGIRCEFREPCPTIQFDDRTGPFPGDHKWSHTFKRLEAFNEYVDAYFRPIYYSEYEPDQFEIFIFGGRRWAATYTGLMPTVPFGDMTALETLATVIKDTYHPGLFSFPFAFISGPVDVGTADDRNSPEGIDWYSTASLFASTGDLELGTSNSVAVDNTLICAECNDVTNKCMYDGKCIDGSCACSIGAEGALCQIPPIGNGHCDSFYNKRAFEFDGGDCCEFTCVSSDKFTCGIDETGYVSLGYSDCRLQKEGWNLSAKPINGISSSGSGFSVGLSSNGKILIISQPLLDQILMFDKVGSQWIQRGQEITGISQTLFGASFAVASSSMFMFNNPFNIVPITLAVGTAFSPTGLIYVYECGATGCSQVGSDLVAFEDEHPLALNIDISSDGAMVAAGAMPFGGPDFFQYVSYPLVIFDKEMVGWVKRDLDLIFEASESVYSVKLSDNGNILAIGSFVRSFSAERGIFLEKDTKRVYEWNGNSWRQRGSAIVDTNPHPALLFNMQGRSVALSDDGSVLGVGFWKMNAASQHATRILTWDESMSDWIQRGTPIVCGAHELQGWSIAFSSDGLSVAIGSADYNGAKSLTVAVGLNGTVCNFRWNGKDHELVGGILPGGHLSSVALSGDGSSVAIGTPQVTLDLAGSTSVYKLPPDNCDRDESHLRLSLTTDTSPSSTNWNVVSNETGKVFLWDGPYYTSGQIILLASYEYEACVPNDDCLIFTIYDNLDLNVPPIYDGVNLPGGHVLLLDGERVATGRLRSAVERLHIGDNCRKCPFGTVSFQMMIQTCAPVAWNFIDRNSDDTVFSNNNFAEYTDRWNNDCSFDDQTTYWEEVCISPDACLSFSIFPLDFVPSGVQNSLTTRNLQYRLFLNAKQIAEHSLFVSPGGKLSVVSSSVGDCSTR